MRMYGIDLIKIVAIYLVICSHVSLYFMHQAPTDFGVLFLRQTGQFGVVMFYMASGYFLLNNRHDDQFSYAYHKVGWIALALVVWLLFYYLYDAVFLATLLTLPDYNFWTFLDISVTLSEASHLWFLFSIIGLYFILPLLRQAFNQQNASMLLKVIVALIMIANISQGEKVLNDYLGIPYFIHPSLLMSSQVYGLVCFLLGGYLSLTYQPKVLSNTTYVMLSLIALASFALLTIQTQYWGIEYFYGKYYNLLLQISSVCIFYLMLHSRFERFGDVITRLGSKTLGIYLIHNIFVMEINGGEWYEIVFAKLHFLTVYGYILVYSLVAFVLSYYLSCLLSKNSWLKRVVSL